MAAPSVTPADVQVALGTGPFAPIIMRADQTANSATTGWYLVRAGVVSAGRTRYVSITNTDSAATQAAAVVTALAA